MLHSLKELPEVETERLRIRPLRPEDAEAVSAISDNPVILEAIVFLPRPFTPEAARTLIAAKGDGRDRFVGAWSKADELLGVLGCHLQGEAWVEIGYWIAPGRHGQGYATEAAGALVELVGRLDPRRRVVARAFEGNAGSLKVLHKLGFRPAVEAGLAPEPYLLAIPV